VVEGTKILEVTSPSAEVTVPRAQKGLTATPKRKRMINVLDVLETIKTSSTPRKTAEAPNTQSETRLTEAEAAKSKVETEAGPSEPAKEKSLEIGEKETEKEATEQILPEKIVTPILKHLPKYLIILYDMLQEKGYLKKKSEKLNTMPEN
jgi:DNA-directed RNA polymerase specialized sigma54-like protein